MNSYYCPRFAVHLQTPSSFLFYFPIVLATTFLIVLGGPSSAATPTSLQPNTPQLIIPPFNIQTATPHPHLQTGLANILATRVSKKTGHIIAPHSTASDKLINLLRQQDNTTAVQKILQEKGETYLLAGTLKEKDEGYEIAIQVFSYQSTIHTNFSQTFNQLDHALSALDELSLDIAENTFSIPRPAEQTEVEPSNNGIEGFQTAHPERFFKEKKYGDTGNSQNNLQPEIKKSAFDGGIQSSRKNLLPSSTALAMTVGDLNNDGKNEFVILERNSLALYHRTGNSSFQHIAFQPIARHLGLHTVFLADLDHNGLQEIYIGASNGTTPASQILEWDGKTIHVRYQNAPYYLQVGVDAGGRPFLFGQENVFQDAGGNAFYSLKKETSASSLRKIKRLTFPPGFNIYDFITVDLNLDGNLEFVGITRGNKLTVIDKSGKTLWKSEINYGASKEILGTLSSTIDGGRHPANKSDSVYMHTRIIAQDLNGDQRPEIILGRNRLADITFFKRLRSFEESSVAALTWEEGKMKTIWESPKLSGYTVDFQILQDKNTPGKFQLISLEQKHANNLTSFWSSKKSIIHSYLLEMKEESEH